MTHNLPNLFIIGAPKCGTTALSEYLSEHPNVFFSNPKEPFFLCDDYPHLKNQHFLSSTKDYLALFDEAIPNMHSVIAEGSTNYLRSERAVQNAMNLSPQAKFIVLLRNPVDVAYSFHMEQIFARNETVRDFETAWNLQPERANGQSIPPSCRAPEFLQYRAVAMFANQIQRFFDIVPEPQRLTLLQEDMAKDTKAVYERTLSFLDLQSDGREAFEPVNSSHGHRFEWLGDLVLSPPKWLQPAMWQVRGYLRRRKPPIVEKFKRTMRVKAARPKLTPDFRHHLENEFEADIAKLETLIDRDLGHWKSSDRSSRLASPTGSVSP